MEFRRIEHGVVDSTSERAFAALAAKSARHGDVHSARAQTAGRGRFGRTWYSAPDAGLYMSVILLPPPPPWSPAALTIASGLAVLAGAQSFLEPGALALEWPNDVVDERGAKLAGVIVETRGFDPTQPHYVLGIGVNVSQSSFPPELTAERAVTSLALRGSRASLDAVAEQVLAALSDRLTQVRSDLRALCADYLAAAHLSGLAVAVRVGEREHVGDLVGMSIEEGLVLRSDGRGEQRIPLEFARAVRAI